jgi:membrane protease YdiL (CAAX protease family)
MSSAAAAQERPRARRPVIYLCLALMLVFPFFSSGLEQAVGNLAPSIGEIRARFVTEGAIWLFTAVVLGIALFGEPRTLASIGLRRPTLLTPLWGLGAAICLLALGGLASFVTYNVLHAPNHTAAQIEAIVHGSLIYALALAVRAGVTEEVLYRGLAIEQLTVLTGRRWLAALVATLAFVAVHTVHFDLRQLIPIATASFGLAALYLWRRNLWINIFAHTLIDAVALGAVALQATNLY